MSKGNGGQAWMQNLGLQDGFAPGAGMRGPGFGAAPVAPATTALPASLASLITQQGQGLMGMPGGGAEASGVNMQALQTAPTGTVASNPNYPVLDFRMQPTYADGGQVGPQGMPMMGGEPMQGGMQGGMPMQGGMQGGMPMQGAPSAPMAMGDMEAEIGRVLQQNPQVVQQIQQVIMESLQSGELTMEQLNTAVQLAMAAVQNPQLYPRLRALAIQRGLASEQDLPQQYDQGIVFAILLAGTAAQQMMGGQQTQQPAPQMLANGGRVETFNETFRPGYSMGGDIPEEMSPTGDRTGRADDIPIRVSGGEYVIPKHVVEAKGTEFFDRLLESYKTDAKAKAKA